MTTSVALASVVPALEALAWADLVWAALVWAAPVVAGGLAEAAKLVSAVPAWALLVVVVEEVVEEEEGGELLVEEVAAAVVVGEATAPMRLCAYGAQVVEEAAVVHHDFEHLLRDLSRVEEEGEELPCSGRPPKTSHHSLLLVHRGWYTAPVPDFSTDHRAASGREPMPRIQLRIPT